MPCRVMTYVECHPLGTPIASCATFCLAAGAVHLARLLHRLLEGHPWVRCTVALDRLLPLGWHGFLFLWLHIFLAPGGGTYKTRCPASWPGGVVKGARWSDHCRPCAVSSSACAWVAATATSSSTTCEFCAPVQQVWHTIASFSRRSSFHLPHSRMCGTLIAVVTPPTPSIACPPASGRPTGTPGCPRRPPAPTRCPRRARSRPAPARTGPRACRRSRG